MSNPSWLAKSAYLISTSRPSPSDLALIAETLSGAKEMRASPAGVLRNFPPHPHRWAYGAGVIFFVNKKEGENLSENKSGFGGQCRGIRSGIFANEMRTHNRLCRRRSLASMFAVYPY